jgi:hypothetical protein
MPQATKFHELDLGFRTVPRSTFNSVFVLVCSVRGGAIRYVPQCEGGVIQYVPQCKGGVDVCTAV